MKRKILIIQVFLIVCMSAVYSQKTSLEIGGKVINELATWKNFGPGAGLQVVYKVTKHSGLETGIYYKINPKHYLFPDSLLGLSYEKFNERVILIPILYRFDSKIINFTAGFGIDYIISLKDIQKKEPLGYPKDYFNRIEFVSILSISKTFYLNNSWILEPEIRGTAFVPAGGGGVGLNISLRKKIF